MTETQTLQPTTPFNTAVLFLVFNRPDVTARVFEAIRQARPPRLYVAADGPRANRPGEAERCAEVRRIATDVDWPCEVKTLFRDENLGCKRAVSEGITWFFEHEEQGIILEDDCLPSQSFFPYCELLLNYYKNDERIFIISGYNKQNSWHTDSNDYFFSNFGGIWGWASWRRAWCHYDIDMNGLEKMSEDGFFEKALGNKLGSLRKKQLIKAKKQIMDGTINTWDYQWGFSRHLHGGLACVPSVSLIENIGFGLNATHTVGSVGKKISRHELRFPIKINPNVTPDLQYDMLFISSPSIWFRLLPIIKVKLRKLFSFFI